MPLTLLTDGLSSGTSAGLLTGGLTMAGSSFVRRAFLVAIPIPEWFTPLVAVPFCPPIVVAQAEAFVQAVVQGDGDAVVVLWEGEEN